MSESKSILDGVPVDDSQMKEILDKCRKQHEQSRHIYVGRKPQMGIVGTCPTCGAPIYGHQILAQDDKPEVKYSCECVKTINNVIGQMRAT